MKIAVALVAVVALVSTSSAATFALFSTQGYDSCNLEIPSGGSGTFYVVATNCTDPILTCPAGLTGTALRIDGLPLGWNTVVTPTSAASAAIGDPFGTNGNVSFGMTQYASSILLYTVTVTPPSPGASAVLRVVPPSPQMWDFDCPLRMGADCPIFPNAACVNGGVLYINTPGDCVIDVTPSSWSQVKELYNSN